MSNHLSYWVVIPAAGIGRRMHTAIPKQYLSLLGYPVIRHTLNTLLNHPRIKGIVIAINAEDRWWPSIYSTLFHSKPIIQVIGGVQRCQSVLNGLVALQHLVSPDDSVLIHDANRPCITATDIDQLLLKGLTDSVGGILATPIRDTVKLATTGDRILTTVDRNKLWHALTPQLFKLGLITQVLKTALGIGTLVTDEASALENSGFYPLLIRGRADNIKITYPEDLVIAAYFMRKLKGRD